jgi:hypothetical protein
MNKTVPLAPGWCCLLNINLETKIIYHLSLFGPHRPSSFDIEGLNPEGCCSQGRSFFVPSSSVISLEMSQAN